MGGTILIVENEPSIQEAIELVLGGSYKLRMSASVEEALAMPDEVSATIQVIFLDGFLGAGLAGEQALPAFRRRFPKAFIVYIGALGGLKASELMRAGASVVLPKPWTISELRLTAARGLAGARG
jgi:DNA-binding NtrC family response regulator